MRASAGPGTLAYIAVRPGVGEAHKVTPVCQTGGQATHSQTTQDETKRMNGSEKGMAENSVGLRKIIQRAFNIKVPSPQIYAESLAAVGLP